ncbi:hypothetical protein PMIN04_011678 [Paraphaeosphaeria minitans]
MPLRSRLRRAFTRGAHDDPQVVKGKKSKNCDPNVYQPGEKMPPLKYRRPVAPEHKAHLESFDWAKAWRRKSTASIYSPMGSRMPSRKSSFSSFRTRRSVRSVHGRRSQSKPRRGDDYRENDSGIGASLSGDHQLIEDSDDEGDITNGESNAHWSSLHPPLLTASSRPLAQPHRRPQAPPQVLRILQRLAPAHRHHRRPLRPGRSRGRAPEDHARPQPRGKRA